MYQVGCPYKLSRHRWPQLQIVVSMLRDERVGRSEHRKQLSSQKRARREVADEDFKLVA